MPFLERNERRQSYHHEEWPAGNLDSKTSERVFELFEELVASGKTIIMVTHDGDQARRVRRTIVIADGEIIEEYLAKTFPTLTREQLVWVTSKLKQEKYLPGSIIIQKGEAADKFFIVTKGYVEVLLHVPGGQELVVARVESGQYFGEIALLHGGPRMVTIRAALDNDVEVAVLSQSDFNQLIGGSKTTRKQMDSVVQERLRIITKETGDNA